MTGDLFPGVSGARTLLREPPHVEPTGWTPPSYFPDLRDAAVLAVDVETKEPDFDHGPGWGRGKGHIVGVSVAAQSRTGERWAGYYPVRHEFAREAGMNCNPDNVFAWLREHMVCTMPKVGANLLYDIGWLGEENIKTAGPLFDVQYAEALLTANASDESPRVNLDALATKYTGEGKDSAYLYEWCARAYGGKPTGKQRGNIWRAPPSVVGAYATRDAVAPLDVLTRQWGQMQAEGLIPLFKMECGLIPLLIDMRREGVSVDIPYSEKLYLDLGVDVANLKRNFKRKYGIATNVNSADEIAFVFDKLGLPYPRTEATRKKPQGNPSFKKEFLQNIEHPIGADIIEIRELEKVQNTFVKSYLLESSVNGKVHCSFHPLKGEENGAKTGRLASSDPNLQNIPVRTETGKKVRAAFIPDAGHVAWEKNDYSQIEYRMLAHFAVDDGDGSADALRQNYIDNPDADYHDVVYYNVCPYMGWDPTDEKLKKNKRRPIKNVNFGLLYGQGQGKLGRALNLSPAEAAAFFNGYHSGAPYVKPSMKLCADEVHKYGYVTTLLGRRTRFEHWEPIERDFNADRKPLPYEWALRQYGSGIKRALDYRAVNYKFQGSAADVMKRAMLTCYESGVFDVTGVPRLTVHDELDFSVIDYTKERNEAHREMVHILENAVQCRIPIRVDGFDATLPADRQPNRAARWGDIG